jgi:hypothetical protein
MEPISALVGAAAAVLATVGIREWFSHSRRERRLRRFRQSVDAPLEQIYQQRLKHLDLVVDAILQEHLIECGFSLADIDDNLLRMARRLCLERLIEFIHNRTEIARKARWEAGSRKSKSRAAEPRSGLPAKPFLGLVRAYCELTLLDWDAAVARKIEAAGEQQE